MMCDNGEEIKQQTKLKNKRAKRQVLYHIRTGYNS